MEERRLSGKAWCVSWDSEDPEGRGEETVYFRRGNYTFTDSSTGERFGPYTSLQAMLDRSSLACVNEATMSVSSEILTAKEIVALLGVDLPFGRTVGINGEEWECVSPGVLKRMEEDGQG